MPRKILFIHGSPRRNGNTRSIANVAIQTAKNERALITELDVSSLSYKVPGCSGCGQCQRSEDFACVVDDEIAQSIASLPEYDVIVMATPIHWWSSTAQMKIFTDRMSSLVKFSDSGEITSALAGKTIALLSTGGSLFEKNLELLEQQWSSIACMMSCGFKSCLFPHTPIQPNILGNDPEAAEKAGKFGRLLAGA